MQRSCCEAVPCKGLCAPPPPGALAASTLTVSGALRVERRRAALAADQVSPQPGQAGKQGGRTRCATVWQVSGVCAGVLLLCCSSTCGPGSPPACPAALLVVVFRYSKTLLLQLQHVQLGPCTLRRTARPQRAENDTVCQIHPLAPTQPSPGQLHAYCLGLRPPRIFGGVSQPIHTQDKYFNGQ